MSRRLTGTRARSCPSTMSVPPSGFSSPAMMRSVVVFPAALGPNSTKNSAVVHLKVHAAQRVNRAVALGQVREA